MDAVDNQLFLNWYKTTKDILNIFRKESVFGLMIIKLRILLHTNILCKSLIVYECLDQKWLTIQFLFLPKNDMNCFENSSCKRLSFNNSASSSWARQVCALLKFQLCLICGSSFSWIKVQSASETVHEAFNFSLKLLGVLSKQLA